MIDLHTHSTASDGVLAPADLVARAAGRGVTVLALTDHDTLEGIPAARAAAEAAGVQLVPGVELSVTAPQGSMHLLGYLPADAPEPLASRLRAFREGRRGRVARMVERLEALGAPVDLDDVLQRAAGSVGRPHVADALVDAGHVASRAEAFERYLGDRGPAYVAYDRLAPEEAVRLVRASGGVPVLAHPASLRMGERHLRSFVQRLGAAGLAGIEVHRPDHDVVQRREYGRLARTLGLLPAGGSDFHRPGDGPEPGDTGPVPLPAETAARLLAPLVAA
ncbi:MAG TPA: PHP domain-containing protein [Miltoncostaeaceae bacterium]|nr:PHP domain-containing protein [Miltoncostaeaceae bacterium]